MAVGVKVKVRNEVSCRVTNSIIKYLESRGYDVDSVLDGLPCSKEYLSDPFNWVACEVRETISRRAVELTGDDNLMYQVGLSVPDLGSLGGVESMIRLLRGPKQAYRLLDKYAALFDRILKFKTAFGGDNQATVSMKSVTDYPPSKYFCRYVQGILAAIPLVWGLSAAEVREKQCMCPPPHDSNEDGIQYGAEACVFDVTWRPLPGWRWRLCEKLFLHGSRKKKNASDLEENFWLLDRKNTELENANAALKNTQLRLEAVMKSLSENERKFRLIADNTVDYISILTFKGVFIYVSPSHRKCGYEECDLLGKCAFDMMYPDDRKRLLPLMLKYAGMKFKELLGLKMESFSEAIEFRFPDKSGNLHHFEAIANLIDAVDGKGFNILLISRDVTERKRVDRRIKSSEEKYRLIFESANDILLLLNNKGNIIDVNQKITNIGGYCRDDVLGKNITMLAGIMSRESIAQITKNFKLRLLGINVPPYEVEMRHSSGEMHNMEVTAVTVKDDNKIIGILAALRDVTERRRSESALSFQRELIEQIIANIPNAVLVISSDTRILLANEALYTQFHLSKVDMLNKTVGEAIGLKELDQAIVDIMRTGGKNLSLEFRHQVGGVSRIVSSCIVRMQDQRYLILMNDITEEREKQERLYLTDRLASVGEMASGVAHELNNPLTGIIGLSNLVIQKETDSETKEDLLAISTEAHRCAEIIKNLLSFARKHPPQRAPMNIAAILEDVLKLRAYEQRGQNIAIETHFAPDLPEVNVDYFQMQQVFLNIILNAEAAMVEANGCGTLKITGERIDGHINISFADDGPGIPPENLGLIFNPFFTTKEVGKGTGLGLSICYGIVTSHGGKIYARSTPGHGATFVIELPVNDHQTNWLN